MNGKKLKALNLAKPATNLRSIPYQLHEKETLKVFHMNVVNESKIKEKIAKNLMSSLKKKSI